MGKFDWRHEDLDGDEKPKSRSVKKEMKQPKLTDKKNKNKGRE